MPVRSLDRGEEVAAVLGLAGGAGGGRDDLVDLVRVGEPAELGERLQAAGHRRRGQGPAVEAAGAQPDHLLLAVDDLERQIGADLRHDHVHGVGADVDRGEAHGGHRTDGAAAADMRHALVHPRLVIVPSAPAPAADGARRPLASSLGGRLEALAGHLDEARSPAEERGIHQARVATPPPARDRAGGRRDAEGARRQAPTPAEAADPRPRTGPRAGRGLRARHGRAAGGKAAPGVVALRAHLTEAAAGRASSALREACDAGRAKRLVERLDRRGPRAGAGRSRRAVASWRAANAGGWPVASSIARRRSAIAVAAAGAILIVDRVHAVRIAAKRLRYALELDRRTAAGADGGAGRQPARRAGPARRAARPGRAARTRRRGCGATLPPDSIVAKDLERMSTALDADIRQLHARYLRGAQALAALTDRVRDRIAPCLDPSISI